MNIQKNFNMLLGGGAVLGREFQRMGVEQAAQRELDKAKEQREAAEAERLKKVAGYKEQLGTLEGSLSKSAAEYSKEIEGRPENWFPSAIDQFGWRRKYGQFLTDYKEAERIHGELDKIDPSDETTAAFKKFKELYGSSYGGITSDIEMSEEENDRLNIEYEEEKRRESEPTSISFGKLKKEIDRHDNQNAVLSDREKALKMKEELEKMGFEFPYDGGNK